MVDKFNDKSIAVQHMEREKNLLEIKLREKELEIELTLTKSKCNGVEEVTRISEEKDRTAFGLYKRLSEAETFRAKSEALGISMSALQKELETEQLHSKKIKDINIGITGQIKHEKERNAKLASDNEHLIMQIEHNQQRIAELDKRMKELESELDSKINECCEMHVLLSSLGSNSFNSLENALSDHVDDLQKQLEELRAMHKTVSAENKHITTKYDNMVSRLSSLMSL